LRPGRHHARRPDRRARRPRRARPAHPRGRLRGADRPEDIMKMLTINEAKLLVREPLALFWGLAFPMALLAVMGLSSSDIGGVPLVTIYEPIVIPFGGVGFGGQGFPVE